MDDVIRIKPHHFVDIITRYGEGGAFGPHAYGHALHTVAERVLSDRDVTLVLEFGADDICAPCAHNVDGLCNDTIDTSFRPEAPSLKREWNLLLDERWCGRLHLRAGDRLTARRFCELLRERSGEIADIYREIPADRTAARAARLAAGVEKFLA